MNVKNRAQVTIFVIVAIVIVGLIIVFFVFKDRIFGDYINPEFRPVYDFYSKCIEEKTESALSVLGTQGGRIDTGLYVPGSDFAPFSSNLNFLGISVPYWFYVTGNNIAKEQVPLKGDMEKELSTFLEED